MGNIQFKFKAIPDSGIGEIEFEAAINTMSARFTPSWDRFKEIGRADPKIIYSEFVKEVDLDFTVVAKGQFNPAVAQAFGAITGITPASTSGDRTTDEIFNKLEQLSKMARPAYYTSNNGYQGVFVEFTVGRIYYKQIGYISNLQYTWENDKTSWDKELPMLTRANMTIMWVGRLAPNVANNVFR